MNSIKNILIIAGNARSLIANRGDLIAQLRALSVRVSALVPSYDALPELEGLGIPIELVQLNRSGMNPLADMNYLRELARQIRRHSPNAVFSYNIKPVIYGSLAARLAGVSRISSMITGLGYLFAGNTAKQRMGRTVAEMLYRMALPCNHVVFFQNPDDLYLFRQRRFLKNGQNAVLVNGSGVNLKRFSPANFPEGGHRFLLIARLIEDKGIAEFVEAACALKPKHPGAHFMVLGPHDPNLPRSILISKIQRWKASGNVTFHPGVKDVRPYLANCSVYVLPSSYREGVPRTVLEAMAMGRPIITTDAPGCRETVLPGENGFLVPVGRADALAQTMEYFIINPGLITQMGRKSRIIAEEKYDVDKVNQRIIQHLMP